MLDITKYPLLDGHCHAFLPEKEQEGLDQLLNLSLLTIPEPHSENTLLFRRVVKELAEVLECSPDWKTVSKKRSKEPRSKLRGIKRQHLTDLSGVDPHAAA